MMSTPKNMGLATSLADLSTSSVRSRTVRVRPSAVLTLAEMTHDVFHHDDRTINDEAEVDGTEAHQVSADVIAHHAGHGKEHGKWDDERDDEGGAEVPEQRKEHDDDEQCALGQVRLHSRESSADEVTAIIEGADDDALRELGLYLGELRPHGLGDEAVCFPGEHDGGSDEGFLPSSVAAPVRKALPMPTVATSLSRMGFSAACELERDGENLLDVVHAAGGADRSNCSPPIST